MPTPLDRPKLCPACGTDMIQPMLREVMLSAHVDGLAFGSSGIVAYHCAAGHVFLVFGSSFERGEPLPDGNGCSLIV